MNLILSREVYSLYGITGKLKDEAGNFICFTLEHAYNVDGVWMPKVASGTYTCERHPPKRLNYETFELQNVPAFQGANVDGILIHRGNYNKDSVGCILVGLERGPGCILESEHAFEKLMELQKDVESFTLRIV